MEDLYHSTIGEIWATPRSPSTSEHPQLATSPARIRRESVNDAIVILPDNTLKQLSALLDSICPQNRRPGSKEKPG